MSQEGVVKSFIFLFLYWRQDFLEFLIVANTTKDLSVDIPYPQGTVFCMGKEGGFLYGVHLAYKHSTVVLCKVFEVFSIVFLRVNDIEDAIHLSRIISSVSNRIGGDGV